MKYSHIGLGTVEIGVSGYGISKEGLIPESEAITLLKAAVDAGVTYIDTARGYGLAEERIGKSGITKRDDVLVGTKCAQFLREQPELRGGELEKKIREEINESRRLLGYETLPLVQLHIESPDYNNLNELIEIMSTLKDEEKIDKLGIASRGKTVPQAAIESGAFQTIQVAYSILDQRMDEDDSILTQAQEANMIVLNRSALLQGTLSPARQYLPEELAPLKEQADRIAEIGDEHGISLPILALRFCISHPAVTTVLIGTTKTSRVEAALNAAAEGALPQELLDTLYSLAINDPKLVDPAQWPKA